jgi:hypothetical protein
VVLLSEDVEDVDDVEGVGAVGVDDKLPLVFDDENQPNMSDVIFL